jgi:hypothetical protein
LVHVGGSKLHAEPHSTVLFEEQIKVNPQPVPVTLKINWHVAESPWLSVTVRVIV